MFCSNCGNQLSDGAIFCGKCGTKVTNVTEENVEEVVNTAPVEEVQEVSVEEVLVEEVQEAPVGEVPVEEVQEIPVMVTPVEESEPQKASKKKSKAPKVLIAILAVVVILVGGFFIFKDAIMNKLMFLLPAEMQLQAVYKDAAKDFAGKSGDIVTKVGDVKVSESGTVSGTISATLGDDLTDLIEQQADIDLKGINTVSIAYKMAKKGSKYLLDIGLTLEKVELISANAVVDLEEGLLAITAPELSETAIEIDLVDDLGLDLDEVDEALGQSEEMVALVKKVLPSEKFIEEIVPRYVEAVIKTIDKVERNKETLDAGEVSQKATSLTVTLDDKLVEKIGKAIEEELEADEALKKYLKKAVTTVAEYIEEDFSEDDLEEWYDDEFLNGVSELFENIAETELIEDGIEIITWVNSDNDIIGFVLGDYFEYISVEDGKDAATKIVLSEEGNEFAKILVEGQNDKDVFAGDVKLYAQKEKVLEINVDKYVSTDKKFELNCNIAYTDEMIEEMIGSGWMFGDIVLATEISATQESSSIKLKAKLAGKELISVGYSYAENMGKATVTYPKEAINMNEMSDWLDTVDPATIVDKLDELGVLNILDVTKAELTDLINMYVDYFQTYYSGDYYDDSYYDDDYDYIYSYDYYN